MARTLSDAERQLTSTALANYEKQLASAETTGIQAVDDMVMAQAATASELSELFAASTRGSVSIPGND